MSETIKLEARLPDLNDLMQDLQLAKEIAIKNENPNSLVTATMAQAKLLGLDRQINEHHKTHEPIPLLTPEIAKMINKELEDEY